VIGLCARSISTDKNAISASAQGKKCCAVHRIRYPCGISILGSRAIGPYNECERDYHVRKNIEFLTHLSAKYPVQN
jgi:hypothetical protein